MQHLNKHNWTSLRFFPFTCTDESGDDVTSPIIVLIKVNFPESTSPNAATVCLGCIDSQTLINVKLCLFLMPNYFELPAENFYLKKKKIHFIF